MKPKDFKYPFSWEERRVCIDDGVLFVPEYYDSHGTFELPTWDAPQLFGNGNPVHIEYCSGNGTWIMKKAQENPDINWVACEKRFDRVRKIWSKKKNFQLDNLLVLCGEALTATKYYIHSGSVDHTYVNFPDPWPKLRHAKHRLLQRTFFSEQGRILKPGKSLMLVTDDPDYCAQMISESSEEPTLRARYPEPHYIHKMEGYGTSYFEALWKGMGRKIHYIMLDRV